MPQDTTVDVAIIGAGWYGLAAARTYLKLRPLANVLIVDDDNTVGGVWSKDRLYPNLVAQVKLGLFNYSDLEMPRDRVHRDDRVSGQMIHDYMQRYAEEHDLIRRIRFNTFVQHVRRNGSGWTLELRDSDDEIHASKIMVCTGVTSIASSPRYNMLDASIPICHSKDLGQSFKQLGDPALERVVVVGAAKSAYDAVYLLLSMGKRVTWVIRPNGAGPLAILPSKVLGLVSSIAVASTRLMTHLSPSILNSSGGVGTVNWALQRTMPGRALVGAFWNVLAHISDLHAGYAVGDHVQMLKPEIERQSIFWANSGLGVVTLPNFWDQLHSDKLQIVRDSITTVKGDMLVLQGSGDIIQTDALVLCTGWGDHFGMFDNETKKELGLPVWAKPGTETEANKMPSRHPGLVQGAGGIDWVPIDAEANTSVNTKLPFLARPPALVHPKKPEIYTEHRWRLYRRSIPIGAALENDRSVAIMGQIHTVQTPLVAEVQCFWSILYLIGELQLPSQAEMAKEIAEWNAWTRKRYLSQGEKFPYSLYDFLPYVDTLFKDLGLNSQRKSNSLSEFFEPYSAADFRGFVDEYLAKNPHVVA